MMPAAVRPAHRHGAPRVSPLSAATLFLLVTMVLASSPAAPKAAFVHPVDPRPVPTRTLTAEIEAEWASLERQTRSEEKQTATAWWGRLTAPTTTAGEAGDRARVGAGARPVCRVRAALLNLPPPHAAL